MSINSAKCSQKILKVVTETAREIIAAHRASTTLVTDDNWQHATTLVSGSDKYAAWREGNHRPDGSGIHALVCRMNKPIRMTQRELEDHPVWQTRIAEGDAPPMRGWLAAPLMGRDGRNLGLIEMTDKIEGDFTEDDQAVLVQLGQMASIAIENTIFAEERETNRIKDEFLSTLSHELRTPLNAILGWTQLLHASGVDGEVAHAVGVIERNAKAQAKLVEDLLDVSRVTTGKLRLNLRTVNFAAVVNAAVDAIRPAAEEKQLTLECHTPARDECIEGDADRLQQVAGNLLSNAIKFTSAGGRIEARLDRIGGNLYLRVTDTGRGINPAFLPHVFDRFRQADSTSTRSHGGLGIGLTIVRHIVELHGGGVRAESGGEGQGATFVVTLPVAATPKAVQPEAPRDDAVSAPRDLNGVRVVLVDDESDARDVVCRVLSRAGAATCAAASVREALAAITREPPDVIVSDIAMPDEDGYDLIRKLRELSPTHGGQIPALALTAYAREEDRLRCLTSGFQAHLPKPVDPRELVALVAHLAARNSNGTPQPQLRYG
jgi:signal transduction histidine kinase/ActR/RegA family two-component response regulator